MSEIVMAGAGFLAFAWGAYRYFGGRSKELTSNTNKELSPNLKRQTPDVFEEYLNKRDNDEVVDVNIIADKCNGEYVAVIRELSEQIKACYYPQLAVFHCDIKVRNARKLYYENKWIVAIEEVAYAKIA